MSFSTVSMQDDFKLEKIEGHIKKIESEVLYLLKILTDENIPSRSSMITQDYYERLQQYSFISREKSRKGEVESSDIEEPQDTKQLIKKILTHIPESITERKIYLEKLMSYFTEISPMDKSVLIESLLHESSEKIKNAIKEIVEAFRDEED